MANRAPLIVVNGSVQQIKSPDVIDPAFVAGGGGAGEIALSNKTPAANFTVTAGYSAYIAGKLEIAAAVAVEVGLGGTLEIG